METCTECGCDIDIDGDDAWTCYAGLYVCAACDDGAAPEDNTNCLQGMRCPKCHSREPFRIVVSMTVLMYDEGSDDDTMGGGIEWEDDNYCECHECHYAATVKDFQQPQEATP